MSAGYCKDCCYWSPQMTVPDYGWCKHIDSPEAATAADNGACVYCVRKEEVYNRLVSEGGPDA